MAVATAGHQRQPTPPQGWHDPFNGLPLVLCDRLIISTFMNASTSKLDLHRTDRRSAKRASTLKSGKLVYGGTWGAVVDCLVLDLTDRGARVETILAVDVPDVFFLRLSDGTERRGYRRWVSGHQIGIEFADGDL